MRVESLDNQLEYLSMLRVHNSERQRAWQASLPDDVRKEKRRVASLLRSDYAKRPITGIDGEGVTCENGHNYVLLAASDGRSISCLPRQSLSTSRCLDFLLTYSGRLVVGFALTYDVNLMLRDLSPLQLRRLHQKRSIVWSATDKPGAYYRISVTPRKAMSVSILNTASSADSTVAQETDKQSEIKGPSGAPGKPSTKSIDKTSYPRVRVRAKYQTVKSVTVWDTFGFFQSSFVEALIAWKIGTPEQIDLLRSLKAQRAQFVDLNADNVRAYNDLECRLLVELITRLRETLIAADIKLKRWDGAGAVAGALLTQHRVKEHVSLEHPPEVMSGYFGGRIQVCQLGEIPGPVYNYDINSAYPFVCRNLPSLHGRWQHVNAYHRGQPWGLWRCRWRLGEPRQSLSRFADSSSPILTPFPVRNRNKNIHYPLQGEGWYWSPLVEIAITNWEGIDVLEGWVYRPDDDTKPFSFIDEYYAHRLVYKRLGDPRHIVIKLGLNSLYGKTAQGLSRRGIPPFRSYVWAGLITATTQATLLKAALQQPENVVCFATDGLYLRRPLDVVLSTDIGGWEETVYDGMTIVQPGLYQLEKDGKSVLRTRGYHDYEIDWDAIRAKWRKGGCHEVYTTVVNRFLTLGVALQTKRLKEWGTWIDETRQLHLRPATGVPGDPVAKHAIRWLPDLKVEGIEMSQPYTPKGSQYDAPQDVARAIDEEQPEPLT